jgi:hypothetical protein
MEFGTVQESVSQRQLMEDRRSSRGGTREQGPERRQFSDARVSHNYEALELADAIDAYKVRHHRKYLTFEELHDVITALGYRKAQSED